MSRRALFNALGFVALFPSIGLSQAASHALPRLGMAVSMLTGGCWYSMLGRVASHAAIPFDSIVMCGVRDVDATEAAPLAASGIPIVHANDDRALGQRSSIVAIGVTAYDPRCDQRGSIAAIVVDALQTVLAG